ncbi:hypothetical protein GCM10022419_077790 [Nonomuraea rosea]|uniref:Uncharacterized protein n=1 Tax=Nonomuraea rosea TaxID=638574 RepID=A0ABP6YIG7_9ACTN
MVEVSAALLAEVAPERAPGAAAWAAGVVAEMAGATGAAGLVAEAGAAAGAGAAVRVGTKEGELEAEVAELGVGMGVAERGVMVAEHGVGVAAEVEPLVVMGPKGAGAMVGCFWPSEVLGIKGARSARAVENRRRLKGATGDGLGFCGGVR